MKENTLRNKPLPVKDEEEKYGPDGRLKSEDGITGYYADGTPVNFDDPNW